MLHPLWLPEITIRQGHVETDQRTGRGFYSERSVNWLISQAVKEFIERHLRQSQSRNASLRRAHNADLVGVLVSASRCKARDGRRTRKEMHVAIRCEGPKVAILK